jgi:hypothetical protein
MEFYQLVTGTYNCNIRLDHLDYIQVPPLTVTALKNYIRLLGEDEKLEEYLKLLNTGNFSHEIMTNEISEQILIAVSTTQNISQ